MRHSEYVCVRVSFADKDLGMVFEETPSDDNHLEHWQRTVIIKLLNCPQSAENHMVFWKTIFCTQQRASKDAFFRPIFSTDIDWQP